MSRRRLLAVWLLCALVAPLLVLMMLLQTLFGSRSRALSMALAFDQCGNSLLGGGPLETISRRTGLAQRAGKPWARWAAPFIDSIFGAGHCFDQSR